MRKNTRIIFYTRGISERIKYYGDALQPVWKCKENLLISFYNLLFPPQYVIFESIICKVKLVCVWVLVIFLSPSHYKIKWIINQGEKPKGLCLRRGISLFVCTEHDSKSGNLYKQRRCSEEPVVLTFSYVHIRCDRRVGTHQWHHVVPYPVRPHPGLCEWFDHFRQTEHCPRPPWICDWINVPVLRTTCSHLHTSCSDKLTRTFLFLPLEFCSRTSRMK
jgi:hypothetical protein